MKYYKYWIQENFVINIDGNEETISILAGSNESEKIAIKKAEEQAEKIEARIATGKLKDAYEVAIREHVDEIVDDRNVITICQYGAKILNTTEYTILDLDDYPVGFFDSFKSEKNLSGKERIVHKFEKSIRKFPELGVDFRVYETMKGVRVIGKKYIKPSGRRYTRLMRKLGVDRIYTELSIKQGCYRARLTPKPYRMNMKTIRISSPLACRQAEYQEWKEVYAHKSREYSVVRLIKAIGNDFSADPAVKKHDLMCNLHSKRKLA